MLDSKIPMNTILTDLQFHHIRSLGHFYVKTSEVTMLAEKPWLTYQMDTLH